MELISYWILVAFGVIWKALATRLLSEMEIYGVITPVEFPYEMRPTETRQPKDLSSFGFENTQGTSVLILAFSDILFMFSFVSFSFPIQLHTVS
jgi:hypothetical protein